MGNLEDNNLEDDNLGELDISLDDLENEILGNDTLGDLENEDISNEPVSRAASRADRRAASRGDSRADGRDGMRINKRADRGRDREPSGSLDVSQMDYDGEKELEERVKLNRSNVGEKKSSIKNIIVIFSIVGFLMLCVIGGLSYYIISNNSKSGVPDVEVPNVVVPEVDKDSEEVTVDTEGSDELSIDVEASEGNLNNDEFINRSSVYDKDLLSENVIFRLGLISEEGLSTPVSFIISKDKLKEDFGTTEVSQYDMYTRYGNSLSEEYLGFVDYHPYKGTLSVDEETETLTFRFDSLSAKLYDTGTASTEIFKNSLIDTFGKDYKNIRFEGSEGDYYYFNHEGELENNDLVLGENHNRYSYYRYLLPNGNEFLGTNFGMSYDNVSEALKSMKNPGNDMYKSLIPVNVDFEVLEKENIVEVNFKETLDLSKYSNKEVLGLIEGLNLTVSGFNKSLKLNNILQKEWQGFDFSDELDRPYGSNKVKLN